MRDLATPFLCVSDVVLGYGRNLVIKGASLALARGEQVCLLGGNGSGKSTLLKGILGLVDVRSGEIVLDGRRIDGERADIRYRLGISFVPQDRKLFRSEKHT